MNNNARTLQRLNFPSDERLADGRVLIDEIRDCQGHEVSGIVLSLLQTCECRRAKRYREQTAAQPAQTEASSEHRQRKQFLSRVQQPETELQRQDNRGRADGTCRHGDDRALDAVGEVAGRERRHTARPAGRRSAR